MCSHLITSPLKYMYKHIMFLISVQNLMDKYSNFNIIFSFPVPELNYLEQFDWLPSFRYLCLALLAKSFHFGTYLSPNQL